MHNQWSISLSVATHNAQKGQLRNNKLVVRPSRRQDDYRIPISPITAYFLFIVLFSFIISCTYRVQ
jgi:hypothetical protein